MADNNNQSHWFRAGFAAYVNYQDGEVPICYDLEARTEWRRGNKAAEKFITDGDDDDGGLL